MSLFTELTLSDQANLSGGTAPAPKPPKKVKPFIKIVGVGGDGGAGGDGGFTGVIIKGKVYDSEITTGNANGGAGGAGGAGISL